MNVKTTAELYDAIEKALQADATAFQYVTEPFSHSFSVKLSMTDEQLPEILWRLNAGERVHTRVPATLEHRWINGSESGAEHVTRPVGPRIRLPDEHLCESGDDESFDLGAGGRGPAAQQHAAVPDVLLQHRAAGRFPAAHLG